jgi:hypothetical protein
MRNAQLSTGSWSQAVWLAPLVPEMFHVKQLAMYPDLTGAREN